MPNNTYWKRWANQRIGRRKAITAGVVAGSAVGAMAALGCGDDDDGAPAPTGTAARQQQPKRGGDIAIIASTGEQPHHDPHLTTTGLLHLRGSGTAYTRLIRRKLGPDISGITIIPEGLAAASWEQPDDRTFLFKLRPEVKWQNIAPVNGRQLVAQDIVYSMTRQIETKTTAAFIPGVENVTATDAATVRVTVKKPDADFIVAMTAGQNKIIAREAVELKGDLKEGPVIGAGGWIFKDWVRNNVVRFVRNPDYWRKDQFGTQLPYGDTLDILRIPDHSTAIAAFRTKKVLVLGPTGGDPSEEDLGALRREVSGLVVKEEEGSSGGGFGMVMRSDIPPTNDIRVRQAVSKAVNRQAVIDTVLSGRARLRHALLAANTADQLLPEDEVKKLLAQDVNAAKQLFQQAGASGWNPQIWVYSLQAPNVPSAELVQAQLKEVLGLNSSFQIMDNVKLTNWFTAHDLAFALAPPTAFVFGPNAYLNGVFRTGGGRNVSKTSDPEIDRLIDAQQVELKDQNRRTQLLLQIQRRIIELAAMTPIFARVDLTATYPNFHGAFAGRTNEPVYYEEVWIDQ